MYISKNLNSEGRVKSYTIHMVTWTDLKRLLVSSDSLKKASLVHFNEIRSDPSSRVTLELEEGE